MKTKFFIALTAVGLLAILVLGGATGFAQEGKGVELVDSNTITADVVAIDRADRTVALRGPEGNVVAVEVGQGARNFDQIQVGDKVRVKYFDSVAIFLGPHGRKPESSVSMVAARSPKGDMPAGAMVETVDVSATVQAINKEKREATLKWPDGKEVTTKVDKSVNFDDLKTGDSVHARITEATAVSVEKS